MAHCEVSWQKLVAQSDALHCPACRQDYREQAQCPDCEQPLEIRKACGAVGCFRPHGDGLQSWWRYYLSPVDKFYCAVGGPSPSLAPSLAP
ncbi:hypothetical protein BG74_00670 [Sodalis-like endosymbiont of Proechinophthirus fluctus]|uniref:YfgJ family double zinc ribbon protein n=1 Tax=Sodalis-like endosymbiont of Proechinophthirus fluctus TaxID=1462730 RepID=UPI0007A7F45F|nr:zinc-ribbon domain-containing protein [Sodalis-like endosymbiont of Proechinophthirus fluctus]KYP97788.1 hypothetical protein BG74_00670 [Sodalis-like endosymbiont of Proechinophthirus fluctus]